MIFLVALALFIGAMWYSVRYEETGALTDIAIAAACAVALVGVALLWRAS